ncbi:MAG: beta-ketoacyl-[acyl-carrier-protein] synthase family protein [Spartobacteria bacterium]|nr:beta-ketoacyl-[acyl-carrier-protein] synthase family protein [Spartobacteria bacterium]
MFTMRTDVHFWTRNKVVITGLGVLAANGIGVDAFWRSLLNQESGIGPITRFDTTDFSCRIAGEITDYAVDDYFGADQKPARMARFAQLAVVAAGMAFRQAGLTREDIEQAAPMPVIMGVSSNAMDVIEEQHTRLAAKGPRHVSAFGVPMCLPQSAVNAIAYHLNIDSRTLTVSTGCSAGLDAIALGAELIRTGRADVVLAGGSDTPITPLTISSFSAARQLSTRNDHPRTASRPFDQDRDGGVIAEGAAVVLLESYEHARARGALPLAEISGTGTTFDQPGRENGSGLADAMAAAMANAGCMRDDVDYLCAHGPSDVHVDQAELTCIAEVFGPDARALPVSSIKGATGNPLAAAGPMQVIAGVCALQQDTLPPTTNLSRPAAAPTVDFVMREPRATPVRTALVNSHSLGGMNTSMVLEKAAPA